LLTVPLSAVHRCRVSFRSDAEDEELISGQGYVANLYEQSWEGSTKIVVLAQQRIPLLKKV
jgi:hypothetical protein